VGSGQFGSLGWITPPVAPLTLRGDPSGAIYESQVGLA
jgi:hypothetical protein